MHTPGPWTSITKDGLQTVGWENAGYRYVTAIVPVVPAGENTETEANARLIAAAPDLLEALKNMCALRNSDSPFALQVIADARKAIAKAEDR